MKGRQFIGVACLASACLKWVTRGNYVILTSTIQTTSVFYVKFQRLIRDIPAKLVQN